MNRNFTDGINFLSKLTIRRAWNAIKIFSSYYISLWTGKPLHWGMPVSISFEPTTSCNLRCPECPSGLRSFTRPTGMLDPDFFKETLESFHKDLLYLIFYFQGEPYLHKSFLELVRHASSTGIYTATSTNGHYLTDEVARQTVESGLDRLIISIDGTTQNTYEKYRIGGKLEKVILGADNVVKWKRRLKSKTPHIVFQFLVVKHNEHQVEELKHLAKEKGINEVGLKTAQVYNYKKGNSLIPENPEYSRYIKLSDGSYNIKNKLLNHCWKLWHSCVITWNGTVVPCCFDKDASHPMGSLQTESFYNLWNNDAYKQFRAQVLQSRSSVEICKNCTEGTKVWS